MFWKNYFVCARLLCVRFFKLIIIANDSFSPSLPLLDLPVTFLADGGAQPGRVSSGIGQVCGQTFYTCDNELE